MASLARLNAASNEERGQRDERRDAPQTDRNLLPPLRNPHARIVGWIRETVSLSDAPVTLDKRCATERDNKTTEKKRAREGEREAAEPPLKLIRLWDG